MKLPFFKTKTNVSKLSETEKNDLNTQILNRLQHELKATSDLINIVYNFTSENGRKGDIFASKMAEVGDGVTYFVNKDKKYQILGRTEKLRCSEHEIAQNLFAKIEMAIKYNCVLTEWNITTENKCTGRNW
ncbi:hypothetical protein [Paenimyroides baculatum]|uniref:Uncharacterized protein n=1 Tax=Paenimyroides baculatum TaxID=2608000 RepID=A0A5M6CG20_9FLAO|nr:hypothetical protein [Paenimyroides baculatum]KAA5532069.1 hypothetical protein F0460_13745 [Paenimyroides baculatum]